jgi:hypothetical protein
MFIDEKSFCLEWDVFIALNVARSSANSNCFARQAQPRRNIERAKAWGGETQIVYLLAQQEFTRFPFSFSANVNDASVIN